MSREQLPDKDSGRVAKIVHAIGGVAVSMRDKFVQYYEESYAHREVYDKAIKEGYSHAESLFFDGRAVDVLGADAEVLPDVAEFNEDLTSLLPFYRKMAYAGLKPAVVFAPDLTQEEWKGVLQRTEIPYKVRGWKKKKALIDDDGEEKIDISEALARGWRSNTRSNLIVDPELDEMTSFSGDGKWQVYVISGRQDPILFSGKAMRERRVLKLFNLLNTVPLNTSPTISVYCALQRQLLRTEQLPIDVNTTSILRDTMEDLDWPAVGSWSMHSASVVITSRDVEYAAALSNVGIRVAISGEAAKQYPITKQ